MGSSDWTGEPLESAAEAEVTVNLPQGKRRRLKVRADEIDALSTRGSDATSFLSRVRARLSWKFSVTTIAALIAGSLIFPALTKQWSDRTNANSIRSEVALDINAAFDVPAFDGLAEFNPVRSTMPLDANHPRPVTYSRAYLKYAAVSSDTTAITYLYFFDADSPLYNEWVNFHRAMGAFENLACVCGAVQWDQNVASVTAYLGRWASQLATAKSPTAAQLSKALIHCGPGQTPLAGQPCAYYMEWAAVDFTYARNYLLELLRTAKPKGYSQGFHDFVSDVVAPFHH
jgi:hypothetical protein